MRRTIVLLFATAVGAGCVGSALESKRQAPEVYRLAAPTLPDAGAPLPAALAVGRPRATAALDTDHIAVTGPQTRFDYYAGVRWAEPAPLMLQQALVQALAADGRFSTVVATPSRVPVEYSLDVELRSFEAASSGAGAPVVRVAVQVTLLDSRKGTRVASFPAVAEVAAASERRAAVLAAFDTATQQVIGTVVSAVRAAAAGAG